MTTVEEAWALYNGKSREMYATCSQYYTVPRPTDKWNKLRFHPQHVELLEKCAVELKWQFFTNREEMPLGPVEDRIRGRKRVPQFLRGCEWPDALRNLTGLPDLASGR